MVAFVKQQYNLTSAKSLSNLNLSRLASFSPDVVVGSAHSPLVWRVSKQRPTCGWSTRRTTSHTSFQSRARLDQHRSSYSILIRKAEVIFGGEGDKAAEVGDVGGAGGGKGGKWMSEEPT